MDDKAIGQRLLDYRRRRGRYLDGVVMVCASAMVVTPGCEQPWTAHWITASSPTPLLRECLDLNEQGFETGAAPASDEQAEAFRSQLDSCQAVTVRVAGQPVAGGMFLPLHAGVTELAGISTIPSHRGRGLGGIVTVQLALAAFDHGADLAFLTPNRGPRAAGI